MANTKYFFISFLVVILVQWIECEDCSFKVNSDIRIAWPLYIQPDESKFYEPNNFGVLRVEKGKTIELYCDKNFAPASLNNLKLLKPVCVGGTKFDIQINGKKQTFEFGDLLCSNLNSYITRSTNIQCYENESKTLRLNFIEVGFEVPTGRFLKVMDICRNSNLGSTYYVKHELKPFNSITETEESTEEPNAEIGSSTQNRQTSQLATKPRTRQQTTTRRPTQTPAGTSPAKPIKKRPVFVQKTGLIDHFPGLNVDRLYTKKGQKKTFGKILGTNADGYFIHQIPNTEKTIDLFLGRGHLAAKADFIYGPQQFTTFSFINVAPQWQSFNGGNWNKLENSVRKFVADRDLIVDVYSGVWGVSSLRDQNGQLKDLFLHLDETKSGVNKIPVPKLYYKVVIDRNTPKKGVVLLGVNNPHLSMNDITKSNGYKICDDVSDQITWINLYKDNIIDGYLYACSVPDFIKVVDHLKNLQVTGMKLLDGKD